MRILHLFRIKYNNSRVWSLTDTAVLDTKSPGNEQNLVLKGVFMGDLFYLLLTLFLPVTTHTNHAAGLPLLSALSSAFSSLDFTVTLI